MGNLILAQSDANRDIKPAMISPDIISVLTYNILADAYAKYHTFCAKNYLSFDYRKKLIDSELRKIFADFVTLQEVDKYKIFFKPLLRELGYSMHYFKRPSQYNPDGSLIAWKTEKWEAIEISEINYNEHKICKSNSLYKRNNIGILITFRDRSNGKLLIVGTSHFYWNPDHEYVKFLQAKIYCQRAYELYCKYNCPIILTGDLNSEPNSYAIKYLLGGDLNIKPGNHIQNEIISLVEANPLRLKSAYSNYFNGSHPEFTNYTKDYKGCLDYILHTEELEVVELGDIPNKTDFRNIEGIPNATFPSDHLPLLANFRYN